MSSADVDGPVVPVDLSHADVDEDVTDQDAPVGEPAAINAVTGMDHVRDLLDPEVQAAARH